ncbi:MAG: hypothetical protein ACTSRS_14015 [Candidatus Helarchaeota archaeon]
MLIQKKQILGGFFTIAGGLLLIYTGGILLPFLFASSTYLSINRIALVIFVVGIMTIMAGALILMNKKPGGGIAIGCAVLSIGLFVLLGFSDDSANRINVPLWFLSGPGVTAFGGLIALLTESKLIITKENNLLIDEAIFAIKQELEKLYAIEKIDYVGRNFGGLLFIVDYTATSTVNTMELINFLEKTLNEKVIIATKMIPDSSKFKDDMYYLRLLKHGFLKTIIKRFTFLNRI